MLSPRRLKLGLRTTLVLGGVLIGLTSIGGGVAAAASASSRVSASQKALKKLIAQAKKEGPLSIWGAPPATQLSAYETAFAKKYGLQVGSNQSILSAAISERYLASAHAGDVQADIIITTVPQLYQENSKYFTRMTPSSVSALSTYPKAAISNDAVIAYFSPLGIAYNTNLVSGSNIPKTWSALTNPAFKRSLIIGDPRTSANKADLFYDLGSKLIGAFAAQNPSIQGSGAAAAQAVAAGSAAVTAPSTPAYVYALPQGAPIKFVVPQGVAYVSPLEVGIPAHAPHPAQARLFLDWLFSRQGESVTCGLSTGDSLPPGLKSQAGCLPLSKNYKLMTFQLSTQAADKVNQWLGVS
jgi:iron(III) transport system substrate-binding protein